jgi:hypothetical protein
MGLTAMFIPRFIAQALGFFEIGGGRGLWFFAELDTIFFDATILALLICLLRYGRRSTWADATVWQVALTTLLTAGALAYVITNFGTLMRHRAMVFAGVCVLLVLVGSRREPRPHSGSDPQPTRGTEEPEEATS